MKPFVEGVRRPTSEILGRRFPLHSSTCEPRGNRGRNKSRLVVSEFDGCPGIREPRIPGRPVIRSPATASIGFSIAHSLLPAFRLRLDSAIGIFPWKESIPTIGRRSWPFGWDLSHSRDCAGFAGSDLAVIEPIRDDDRSEKGHSGSRSIDRWRKHFNVLSGRWRGLSFRGQEDRSRIAPGTEPKNALGVTGVIDQIRLRFDGDFAARTLWGFSSWRNHRELNSAMSLMRMRSMLRGSGRSMAIVLGFVALAVADDTPTPRQADHGRGAGPLGIPVSPANRTACR